jgi:hypothetical protein
MKYKRTITITAAIAVAILTAFGLLRETPHVQATAPPPPPTPVPTPTPCPQNVEGVCYSVLPSDTDGSDSATDCYDRPHLAIGCQDFWPTDPGIDANNNEHYLYLPQSQYATPKSKLLVILGGSDGNARGISTDLNAVATQQGYYVIGLTYPAANANSCDDVDCFGDALREVVTGEEDPDSDKTTVGDHPQDSIDNRLLRVLQWAHAEYPDDGWDRYLIDYTAVDWTKVRLAGHSNGSSHSSFIGSLSRFRDISRVALFAGPDDGVGETDESTFDPATYIETTEVETASRYYGLVHELNKARKLQSGVENDPAPSFKVYQNWNTFGMEDFQERFPFDPEPDETPYFGDAHMLISIDPERAQATPTGRGTTKAEAHNSVVINIYCNDEDDEHDPPDSNFECLEFGDGSTEREIGYDAAWRCVLGTGDEYASDPPIANAGPAQTVECQGNGGANVMLDGSGTRDYDCEMLFYHWTGSFDAVSGRSPTVFFPLGMNFASLMVEDDWWDSAPATTDINVVDTTPPALTVTLTPTVLWPPNHQMVRITATVNVTDSCGGAPPEVVLVSIVSDQPDNGPGDGNTVNDIQDAQIETFDTSFLLRAERAGGDPAGRIYTITYKATDSSGNETFVSKTVHVPHS